MNDLNSEVNFGMLSRGNSDKNDNSERFAGDVEQQLGMHARG